MKSSVRTQSGGCDKPEPEFVPKPSEQEHRADSRSPPNGDPGENYIQVCGLLSSSFHTDTTPGNQPGTIPKDLGLVILEATSEYGITMEGLKYTRFLK